MAMHRDPCSSGQSPLSDDEDLCEQFESSATTRDTQEESAVRLTSSQTSTVNVAGDNHADLDAFGRSSGATEMLMDAAQRGDLALVTFLVESGGVSIDVRERYGGTALMFAACTGCFPVVEYAVAHGASIRAADVNGMTALHFAAITGQIEIVKYLVSVDPASMAATDNDENTPLFKAVEVGHFDIVKFLVDQSGVDLKTDVAGWVCLYIACARKYLDLVAYLIAEGVNVNLLVKDGMTMLHYAAQSGSAPVAELLLDAGADITAEDSRSGFTPLHFAASRGDLAMAKLFVEKRGEELQRHCISALHLAVDGGYFPVVKYLVAACTDPQWELEEVSLLHVATKRSHIQLVEYFLLRGTDVDAIDPQTQATALGIAFMYSSKHIPIMRLLIAHGANVDAMFAKENTCLHYAAELNDEEAATFLLTSGANVHARNDDGATPLHVAVSFGAMAVMCVLLEHGADPYSETADGVTVTDSVAGTGQLRLLQFFEQRGFTHHFRKQPRDDSMMTSLTLAAMTGHMDVVQYLVEFENRKLAQLSDQDEVLAACAYRLKYRSEALLRAVEHGYFDIVKYLCENDADPDVLAARETPLVSFAAQHGHAEIVEYLLEERHGNVHRANLTGATALFLAAYNNHAHVMKVLLAHGAQVDQQIVESDSASLLGATALHYAVISGSMGALEMLLRHGADITATDVRGYGLLTFARGATCPNVPQVVTFLLANGAIDSA